MFVLSVDLTLISMFLRKCTFDLGIVHANQTFKCLRNQCTTKGERWSTAKLAEAPPRTASDFIAGRPKAALPFWFLKVALLPICLWSAGIVATFIAAHFALCRAL